jgi:hypothetical protein
MNDPGLDRADGGMVPGWVDIAGYHHCLETRCIGGGMAVKATSPIHRLPPVTCPGSRACFALHAPTRIAVIDATNRARESRWVGAAMAAKARPEDAPGHVPAVRPTHRWHRDSHEAHSVVNAAASRGKYPATCGMLDPA